jgi:hypothetical protein
MDNFDEVLDGVQAEGEMLVWILERMGHSKACKLCGTPTAPGDLIERRVRTIRQLDMGAGIGQIRGWHRNPLNLRPTATNGVINIAVAGWRTVPRGQGGRNLGAK